MSDKGHGRRLRRARNVVKTFEAAYARGDVKQPNGREAIWVARYQRAKALLLAEVLKAS